VTSFETSVLAKFFCLINGGVLIICVKMLKKNINRRLRIKIYFVSLCVNIALRMWSYVMLIAPMVLYVAGCLEVKM